MTASFALNFILQLYFALVCLSLLCPFSPAAGLNFTPPRTAYSARSLLGTPPAADAALMKYMASTPAWCYLLKETSALVELRSIPR